MDDTIIIGSGLAGITCARALAKAGMGVRVLDKGRGIGGRMATRRVALPLAEVSFDHGAQYLRPRSPAFAQAMKAAGARGWPDADGLVGAPRMSDIPRALAQGLDVRQQTEVTGLVQHDGLWHLSTSTGPYRARRVVLTLPAPQAARLLGPAHAFAPPLAAVAMDPCLTLMAAFPAQGPRPFVTRTDPDHPLAWIAQDSTKPGRADAAVTWVAQTGPAYSAAHGDAALDAVAARLLPLLAEVLGADPASALHASAHRWRYALASTPLGQPFLRNAEGTLYAGGDWCLGPRAEDAWQSGQAMAGDIVQAGHVG